MTSEPSHFSSAAQRLDPLVRKRLPGGAQDRPQAPDGDTKVVDVLGIVAEPDSRVAETNRVDLRAQHLAEPGGERRVGRQALGGAREPERPEDLRRAVGGLGAGLRDALAELAQRAAVARDQLDLDLGEAVRDAAALHHLDGVVHDLGQRVVGPVEPDDRPRRPQLRDGRELAAEQGRAEQRGDLRRRRRPAARLELEPAGGARELQLPDALAVLRAAAQRDPEPRERAVAGVVVDGGEDARLGGLSAQRLERELRRRLELQLLLQGAFERRAGHRGMLTACASG